MFFQFLDAADALESIQAYRQRMLDLCPPTVGQRILDVGCGIGHSALRLAPLVGATGCVVGLDKSEPLITEARRRATGLSAPLTVIPHMILTPYAMYHRVVGGTIAQAVQAGQLPSADVDTWWHALAQAEAAGHFFAGFPGLLVCGHTP